MSDIHRDLMSLLESAGAAQINLSSAYARKSLSDEIIRVCLSTSKGDLAREVECLRAKNEALESQEAAIFIAEPAD
jgi:hypothetical protein